METIEYTHAENLSDEKFSDHVLAICAINATLHTKGVIELGGGVTDNISKNILGKESLSKGVKVYQDSNGANIDVYVVLKYGAKIPAVAWEIQENVKKEIENMTDTEVKSVNIHVQKIKLEKE